MRNQRTPFEMASHNRQYKKRNKQEGSWSNEQDFGKGETDWFLVTGSLLLVLFGVVGLISLIN